MTQITPGQKLSNWQQTGLNLVSFGHGRDIIFAIDLTESVGINDKGRIYLRQIIQDSLQKGDLVHVVPFAKNAQLPTESIEYDNAQDVEKIIKAVPQAANSALTNTDIQCAELAVYRYTAQLNQNRLRDKLPVKYQSVVWLTDAPLNTPSGEVWVEAPNSACRTTESPQGQERISWLENLPIQPRFTKPGQFKLTVVDIPATVQEFCTPAPGGKETCLVNSYLISQLWLSALVIGLGIVGTLGLLGSWYRRQQKLKKPWILRYTGSNGVENQLKLPNKQRISIGSFDSTCHSSIEMPDSSTVGYLERVNNHLYLHPIFNTEMKLNGNILTKKVEISSPSIDLNYTNNKKKDCYISIYVSQ